MKKTLFVLTAAALGAISVPASAGTITTEVRLGDISAGQRPDLTEYVVNYDAPLNKLLNYGSEILVKQDQGAGALKAQISARVGPRLPTVLGFESQAYAEVGQTLTHGDDYGFWGAGVKTDHAVYGPVSVSAGYRHRAAFDGISRLNENRLSGGLLLAVGSGNNFGVNYYRTTGTERADAIGIAFDHRF